MSATATPTRAAAPARYRVRATPTDEPSAAAQPCDYRRAFRGTIGKTAVSYVLDRSEQQPNEIVGWVHYDKEGPATKVLGRLASDGSFTLDEQPGGQLRGTCDASGVLSGSFVLGKRTESFRFLPGLTGAPGHYQVSRRLVSEPNHPACRGLVRPGQITQADTPEPPPDDPDRWVPPIYCMTASFRQQLSKGGGADFRCYAEDDGLRIFGLRDSVVEKRINELLKGDDYERSLAATKPCGGGVSSSSGTTLRALSGDVLVFQRWTSTVFSGAMTAGESEPSSPTIVELRTGAPSSFAAAVELDKLAAVLGRCLPIYERAWRVKTSTPPSSFELPAADQFTSCDDEGFLWGCDSPYGRAAPTWELVPEGIVISRGIIPSVSRGLEGAGPILTWPVLARDGVLRDGSPLASFYNGVTKAPPDALPCVSAVGSGKRLDWSPIEDER